jgi:hypothetical protein
MWRKIIFVQVIGIAGLISNIQALTESPDSNKNNPVSTAKVSEKRLMPLEDIKYFQKVVHSLPASSRENILP